MNARLAEKLRELAARMETAKSFEDKAEIGIDLAIVKSDWERLCFGQLNPLEACKDRELAVAA